MYATFFKRFIDIIVSIFVLCILSWLVVIIVACYVLSGKPDFLFSQRRTGYREKPFTMFKFRTLSSDESLSLHDRQFGLGKILRRSSLDELPQLINVIRGEMSIVGPRPLPENYLPLFSSTQRQRYTVRPGITGLAQVEGRHALPWNEKLKLDVYYVSHLSFYLDMKILIKTVGVFLTFRKDISLTEEPFKG